MYMKWLFQKKPQTAIIQFSAEVSPPIPYHSIVSSILTPEKRERYTPYESIFNIKQISGFCLSYKVNKKW